MAASARRTSRGASRPKGWRAREASQRGQENEPFEPSTPAQRRAGRHRARQQAKPLRDAYQQGRQDALRARRRRAPASVRTAQRQLVAPVRAQTGSVLRLVGISFAVIFLYDVLQAPGPTAGFLNAPAKALAWLSAPDRGIPKKG